MGLPIGQAPVALTPLSGTRSVRPATFFDQAGRSSLRSPAQEDNSKSDALISRPNQGSSESQLGSNPLTGPGAALNAVSRTVRETRKLVPSISELEIGFRQQASESRAQVREAFQVQLLGNPSSVDSPEPTQSFQPQPGNRVEFRIPDPSAQAQNFVDPINDTPAPSQTEDSGEVPAPSNAASFQTNEQSLPIRETTPGVRLNITV